MSAHLKNLGVDPTSSKVNESFYLDRLIYFISLALLSYRDWCPIIAPLSPFEKLKDSGEDSRFSLVTS
jgi:hypothetical protein